jgi:hypothetical protein
LGFRNGGSVKKIFGLVLSASLILSGCTDPSNLGPEEPTVSSDSDTQDNPPAGSKSSGNYIPTYSTSFDSKWETSVSREEMIETALFRLFEDLDSIRDDDCSVKAETFLGPPLLEEHHYLVEEIANGMVSSFCRYLENDIPVISGSYDFLKETIAAEGLPSDEFGGNCGFDLQQDYASACAIAGVAWTGISLGSKRQGEAFIEERRLTIAAHELFHVVHDQINPNGDPLLGSCRSYSCQGPVWFFEGAGEFFGRAMTQYLGLQNYATFVPTDRSGYYLDGEYLSDLDFLTDWGKRAGSTENYYSGQVAMELLIANVGLLPVLGVWENLDSGQPFPDAFESSIGIELTEFYEVFRVLHERLYAEGGYCDTNVGCSVWNKPDERRDWFSQADQSLDGHNHGGSHSQVSAREGLREDCVRDAVIWWYQCSDLELGVPKEPENSDHGKPLAFDEIPQAASCEELEEMGYGGGWSASFEAQENALAEGSSVSSQIYAALSYLDVDSDGVICN